MLCIWELHLFERILFAVPVMGYEQALLDQTGITHKLRQIIKDVRAG